MSKLQDLQAQLQAVLDERITELHTAIEATETTTRQILSAELEIARHRQAAEGLEADANRLSSEQTSMRTRAEEVRASHAKRVEERDLLRLELEGIEEEQADLDKEVTELRKKVKKAEDQNEKLTGERDSLSGKLTALEDNMKMMKQLKSDLMKSIQENMNELSGSE